MSINRHNYEEYFILYVDKELDAAGRRMVEEFVQLHPDLKDELDLLLQSTFSPDDQVKYEGKEELLFGGTAPINLSNYEDWLILYLDQELDPAQRDEVENFVAAHPEARTALELYRKTKLPAEEYVFPDKSLLYRHEEKTRRFAWWRIAAAAVLLLAAATSAILLLDKPATVNNPGGMAHTNIPSSQDPVAKTETPATANNQVVENSAAGITGITTESTADTRKTTRQAPVTVPVKPVPETAVQVALVSKKETYNLPAPDENPHVYASIDPSTELAPVNTNTPSKLDLTNTPETRNRIPVTNGIVQASLPTTTPEETGPEEPEGRKNKLRGFFRKVTRTFEKRTNIDATDDDDRLLVGGLAIRL